MRYLAAMDLVQTVVFVPAFVLMVAFFFLRTLGKYLFLGVRDENFYDFFD